MDMNITKETLEDNGYEFLTFDPNWLVAFRSDKDSGTVEIFWKDLTKEDDEGEFKTLLYDEIETIHKVITREY